jgi:hypothetical protein
MSTKAMCTRNCLTIWKFTKNRVSARGKNRTFPKKHRRRSETETSESDRVKIRHATEFWEGSKHSRDGQLIEEIQHTSRAFEQLTRSQTRGACFSSNNSLVYGLGSSLTSDYKHQFPRQCLFTEAATGSAQLTRPDLIMEQEYHAVDSSDEQTIPALFEPILETVRVEEESKHDIHSFHHSKHGPESRLRQRKQQYRKLGQSLSRRSCRCPISHKNSFPSPMERPQYCLCWTTTPCLSNTAIRTWIRSENWKVIGESYVVI